MLESILIPDETLIPDVSSLITEDDTPVDNFASEKQQRLLVSALYSSKPIEVFLTAANVGIYYALDEPAIVPDVFLSLDVEVPENWWEKSHRCYLVWEFGKPPEVAIEIVSNRRGEELGKKLEIYQKMRVSYYAVYDPNCQLGSDTLHLYELRGRRYFEMADNWLEQVGLGLTIWEGKFEDRQDFWLRWCDRDGNILLTGDERSRQAQQRAENAEQRAENAEQRAENAEQRMQRLTEQLRSLGIEPDSDQ